MRQSLPIAMLLAAACSRPQKSDAPSIPPTITSTDDSVLAHRTTLAPALADTARVEMATLLKHPESAAFDSLMVVQPPKDGSTWPALAVCGLINGKPGIAGRSTPSAFIFQNKQTVFVLDATNRDAFMTLRAKLCDAPGARVLVK